MLTFLTAQPKCWPFLRLGTWGKPCIFRAQTWTNSNWASQTNSWRTSKMYPQSGLPLLWSAGSFHLQTSCMGKPQLPSVKLGVLTGPKPLPSSGFFLPALLSNADIKISTEVLVDSHNGATKSLNSPSGVSLIKFLHLGTVFCLGSNILITLIPYLPPVCPHLKSPWVTHPLYFHSEKPKPLFPQESTTGSGIKPTKLSRELPKGIKGLLIVTALPHSTIR